MILLRGHKKLKPGCKFITRLHHQYFYNNKLALAVEQYPHIKAVSFVGGVACNKFIKKELHELCATNADYNFFITAPQFAQTMLQ